MTTQILTIGKRRFVLVAERDFHRLQKRAAEQDIRPEFADSAMRELNAYRTSGKSVKWSSLKQKLGL